MGRSSDPVTLHKYAYGNLDPVNNIDPTGQFSMGSMMSAINVMGNLATLAQTTYNVFQLASGDSEVTARQLGTEIMLSMLPIGKAKMIMRKACNRQRNSLTGDTLVYSEYGLAPVETLSIGDEVLSYNEELGIYEFEPIVHLITGTKVYDLYIITLESGEKIEATAEHPFYIEGAWIDAINLKIGDGLNGLIGNVFITDISIKQENTTVYNFTVDKNHNYLVGSDYVLTHNSSCDFYDTKIDARHVRSALGNYRGRTWTLGGNRIRLSKERMQHITQRHHPRVRDPNPPRRLNTQFPKSWSLQDVETAVFAALQKASPDIARGVTNVVKETAFKGVRVKITVRNGLVKQFTPLE